MTDKTTAAEHVEWLRERADSAALEGNLGFTNRFDRIAAELTRLAQSEAALRERHEGRALTAEQRQAECGHFWTKAGTVADGDFCKRCGAKRPAGGLERADPTP